MCDDIYDEYGETPDYDKEDDELWMEDVEEYKGYNKGRMRM